MAHNNELKSTKDIYERELKEKDQVIETYEKDMRQNNDQISKKQIVVDRLNKKMDTLTSGREDVNTGPLEVFFFVFLFSSSSEKRNRESGTGLQKPTRSPAHTRTRHTRYTQQQPKSLFFILGAGVVVLFDSPPSPLVLGVLSRGCGVCSWVCLGAFF